jgi:hypothetical protein
LGKRHLISRTIQATPIPQDTSILNIFIVSNINYRSTEKKIEIENVSQSNFFKKVSELSAKWPK